jgi:malate dehydrogenase (quinone)
VLKELEPSFNIMMLETLEDSGLESSQAWNNAGTGHAANCELNYTPQREDGSVDISEALKVNTEFDLSRLLWSYLIRKGGIPDPRSFIHPTPHMSFVWGQDNVAFLRKRFEAMSANHCYYGMEYSDNRAKIAEWAPLIIDGRGNEEPFAATRIITGTDVDYGALTRLLVKHLRAQPGFSVHYKHRVVSLDREHNGAWRVGIEDVDTLERNTVTSRFVFIGRQSLILATGSCSAIPDQNVTFTS